MFFPPNAEVPLSILMKGFFSNDRKAKMNISDGEKGKENDRKVKENEKDASESESEDERERCSAGEDCKINDAANTDFDKWVACDDCDSWWHIYCVGKRNIRRKEMFLCRNCK